MDLSVITALGHPVEALPVSMREFSSASRVGNLLFTSGQVPQAAGTVFKGKVGAEIDLETAQKAAEMCAVNCLRAALAVADAEELERVVKVFGMVNVASGFSDTPSVIDAATRVFNQVFADEPSHARSAVGMVIPDNWAVEIDCVFALRPGTT